MLSSVNNVIDVMDFQKKITEPKQTNYIATYTQHHYSEYVSLHESFGVLLYNE